MVSWEWNPSQNTNSSKVFNFFEREIESDKFLPSTGLLPKYTQELSLGILKARNQTFNPRLPLGQHRSKDLNQYYAFLECAWVKSWNHQGSQDLNSVSLITHRTSQVPFNLPYQVPIPKYKRTFVSYISYKHCLRIVVYSIFSAPVIWPQFPLVMSASTLRVAVDFRSISDWIFDWKMLNLCNVWWSWGVIHGLLTNCFITIFSCNVRTILEFQEVKKIVWVVKCCYPIYRMKSICHLQYK